MAFKKLIWHFYVAVAFQRLPRWGRVLSVLHCSNSLRAPSPSHWKGLHRTRERAGERGGSLAFPSARGGGGRQREGGRGGAWGLMRPGTTGEPLPMPPPPRDSPVLLRTTRKAILQPPSPPLTVCCRPVIALEAFPSRAHLPLGTSSRSFPTCPWHPPL